MSGRSQSIETGVRGNQNGWVESTAPQPTVPAQSSTPETPSEAGIPALADPLPEAPQIDPAVQFKKSLALFRPTQGKNREEILDADPQDLEAQRAKLRGSLPEDPYDATLEDVKAAREILDLDNGFVETSQKIVDMDRFEEIISKVEPGLEPEVELEHRVALFRTRFLLLKSLDHGEGSIELENSLYNSTYDLAYLTAQVADYPEINEDIQELLEKIVQDRDLDLFRSLTPQSLETYLQTRIQADEAWIASQETEDLTTQRKLLTQAMVLYSQLPLEGYVEQIFEELEDSFSGDEDVEYVLASKIYYQITGDKKDWITANEMLRTYHQELGDQIEIQEDSQERLRLLSLKAEVSLSLLADGPMNLKDLWVDKDLDQQALNDLADLRWELQTTGGVSFGPVEKFPALLDLSAKTAQLSQLLEGKESGEVVKTFQKEKAIVKELIETVSGELLQQPGEATEEQEIMADKISTDLSNRLGLAIDRQEIALLANFDESALVEFSNASQAAHALMAFAGEGEAGLSAHLQAAQVFAQLGLSDRVSDALAPLHAQADQLEPLQRANLEFALAQVYQTVGNDEQANAAFDRIIALETARTDGEVQNFVTLARGMKALNGGELEKAARYFQAVPDNELAQDLTAKIGDVQIRQRAGRALEVLQLAVSSEIAVLEENGKSSEARALKSDFEAYLGDLVSRLEQGNFENLGEVLSGLDQGSALDLYFYERSAGGTTLNFMNQGVNKDLSDEEFSQELLGLAEKYAERSDFATAGAIANLLQEDPWVGSQAKIFLTDLPDQASMDALIREAKNFTIYFAESDTAALKSAGMTLATFGTGKLLGVGAEALWTTRMATRISSPALFRAGGWLVRSGSEAAGFTLASFSLQSAYTGRVDHWTLKNFSLETGKMLVTFGLLHGAGAGMRRLGAGAESRANRAWGALQAAKASEQGISQASRAYQAANLLDRVANAGMTQWGGRVLAFTGSDYFNEAIGENVYADWHHAEGTSFGVRLAHSAFMDAQMMLAGKAIDAVSGGRLGILEGRSQQIYQAKASIKPFAEEIDGFLAESGLTEGKIYQSVRRNLLLSALKRGLGPEELATVLRDPQTWVVHDVRLLAAVNRCPEAMRDGLLKAEAENPGAIHEFFAAVEVKNYHLAGSLLRKHKIPYWITPKGKLRAKTEGTSEAPGKGTEAEVAQAYRELGLEAIKRLLKKAGLFPSPNGVEGPEPRVVWEFLKAHFDKAIPFSMGSLVTLMAAGQYAKASQYLAQTGLEYYGVSADGKIQTGFGKVAAASEARKAERRKVLNDIAEDIYRLQRLAQTHLGKAKEEVANSESYAEEKTVVEEMPQDPKTGSEDKTPVIGLELAAKDRMAEAAARRGGFSDELDWSSSYLRPGQLSEREIYGQKRVAEKTATQVEMMVRDFSMGLGLIRPTNRHIPVSSGYKWSTLESGQKVVHCHVRVEGKERAAQLEYRLVAELGKKLKEISHENGVTEYVIPSPWGEPLVRITFETKELPADPAQSPKIYEDFKRIYYPVLAVWVRENSPRGHYASKILTLVQNYSEILKTTERSQEKQDAAATVLAHLQDVPFMIRQMDVLHRSRMAELDSEQWGLMLVRHRLERKLTKLATQVEGQISYREMVSGKIDPEHQKLWEDYQKTLQELGDLVGAPRPVEAIDLPDMVERGGKFQVILVPYGMTESLQPSDTNRFVIPTDIQAPQVIGEFRYQDGKWEQSLYHADHFSTFGSGFSFLAGTRPLTLQGEQLRSEPGFPVNLLYQPAKVLASFEERKRHYGAATGNETNLMKFYPEEIQTLSQLGIHPDSLAAISHPGKSDSYKNAMVYALGYLLRRAVHYSDGRTEWAIGRLTGALRQQLHRGGQSTATLEKLLTQFARRPDGLPQSTQAPAAEVIFLSGTQQKYLAPQFGGLGAPTMVTPQNVLGILVAIHQRSSKGSYMGNGHQKLKLKPTGREILSKIIHLYGKLVQETHPDLYQHYMEITHPEPRGWESTTQGTLGRFADIVARMVGGRESSTSQPELDGKNTLRNDLSSFGFQRASLVGKIPGLTRQMESNFDRGGMVQWLMDRWYETQPTNGAMTGNARPVSEVEAAAYQAWQAENGFPKVSYSQAEKAWNELRHRAEAHRIRLTIQLAEGFVTPQGDTLKAFLDRRGAQVVYLNEMLKTLPESFLRNAKLEGIHLDTQRIGSGRFGSFEDGHAYIYTGAFNGSRRNFAGLVLHELGHGTAERYKMFVGGDSGIPVTVKQKMYQSFQMISRDHAHVGLDYLDGSSARQRYQEENFVEFLAELNLTYVAAGSFLRQHIGSLPEGSAAREAWEYVYNEMKNEVFGGVEFDGGRVLAPRPILLDGDNKKTSRQGEFGSDMPSEHYGTFAAWTDPSPYYKHNEEGVAVNEDAIGQFPNGAVVVDGMGGMGNGDIASQITVRKIVEMAAKDGDLVEAFRSAAQAVGEFNGEVGESGAVAVAHRVLPKAEGGYQLEIVHTGDARAIVFVPDGKGGYTEMTRTHDHSFGGQDYARKRRNTIQMRIDPHSNIVLSAIGGRMGEPQVDRQVVDLPEGAIVVMGSDGLWDNVNTAEVAEVLARSGNPQENLGELREILAAKMDQLDRVRNLFKAGQGKTTRVQVWDNAQEAYRSTQVKTVELDNMPGYRISKKGTVYAFSRRENIWVPVDHYKFDNQAIHIYRHNPAN